MEISNSIFINCTATSGGAIYSKSSSALIDISSSNFTNCSATGSGGAMYLTNGKINNCIFSGCSATNGGAIYLSSNKTSSDVSYCNFVGCSAISGGAVYWNSKNSASDISSSNFANCSATGSGGAIYCSNNSNGNFYNFEFTGCSATNGGAIYCNGFINSLDDCNFINNYVSTNGSVIYISTSGHLIIGECNATSVSGDNKALIYNEGLLSPRVWDSLIITTLNSTNKNVNYGDNINLTANMSISNMSIAGGIITFKVNGSEINATSDVNGLYSVPYTVNFIGVKSVNATYLNYDGEQVVNAYNITSNGKEVTIILSSQSEFIACSGDEYIITIKCNDEFINEGYEVVLELINDDKSKNYTLTTNESGKVSLPIYLATAKIYTFNIYFKEQECYYSASSTQDIIVKAIETQLITNYIGDKFESTVFSYDDWTAKLVYNGTDKPVSGVIVDVKFTGLDGKVVVYKIKSDSNGDVKLPLRLGYKGLYKISASFEGNSHYASSSSNIISVNISKASVNITANNVTTTNKSGGNYTIQLLTADGKAVSGVNVYINFTNKEGVGPVYKLKTGADGKAFLPLNLAYPGIYFLEIIFNDTDNYNNKITLNTQVKVELDDEVLARVEE